MNHLLNIRAIAQAAGIEHGHAQLILAKIQYPVAATYGLRRYPLYEPAAAEAVMHYVLAHREERLAARFARGFESD